MKSYRRKPFVVDSLHCITLLNVLFVGQWLSLVLFNLTVWLYLVLVGQFGFI